MTPRVATAPLHAHPAGRRDDRQPDPIRPCPNLSAHHTWTRTHHQHNLAADLPASSPTACTGPAQRQDRSSSLRCGRSVLTHRPLPGAVYPEAESQQNHWSTTLLTQPRPLGMTVPRPDRKSQEKLGRPADTRWPQPTAQQKPALRPSPNSIHGSRFSPTLSPLRMVLSSAGHHLSAVT